MVLYELIKTIIKASLRRQAMLLDIAGSAVVMCWEEEATKKYRIK